MLADKDDDYKRYNTNYDNQKKGLEIELKKAYDEIRDMRSQVLQFEALSREYSKLKDEKEILQNKVRLLTPVDPHDVPTAYQTGADLQKKVELLSADKEYLGRENIRLNEVNKRLENKNDELSVELADSKRMVQRYLQDLLDARQGSSLSYEKRLNDDLAAIREKNSVGSGSRRENLNSQKQISPKSTRSKSGS